MEELSLDNILSGEQINNLFSNSTEESNDSSPQDNNEEESNKEKEKEKENNITEFTPEGLFGETESVGNEDDNKDQKDTTSTGSDTSSNFYSSIANALVGDGVLQNLDEEEVSKIQNAEDFANVINNYINNQLDEKQKRIEEALSAGIEPTEIQKYENYISTLNGINDEALAKEDQQGENLRKNLIYQDCINKGFSKEKALKMVERSFKVGTDIEDARDALNDNKEYFNQQYTNLIKEAKAEEEKQIKEFKKQAEKLKTSILEEDKAFGDISLDKSTRQKIYNSITKPVYTDPDTGDKLTEIQKYEKENKTEFIKNIGLLYVLTDGFKNINKLVDPKVKKENKKNLRNLEQSLKGNVSFEGGSLSFANNIGQNDPESLYKGWKLDV